MRVLLIGSSFSAVPMLRALLEAGAHVTVIGRHKADPCHAYVTSSVFEDYSDRDALLECCRREGFDFIVPTCNDYSYVAAAHVSSVMGFPGFDSPETTSILHTKDHFRRFCAKNGIPAPVVYGEFARGSEFDSSAVSGKVIIKPVDSFSGRGVEVVAPGQDVRTALQRAFGQSRNGRVVVEQFVSGSLHSHTAFISSGKIVWHDFVDEYCEVYPYQVDRSTYPSSLPSSVRKGVHDSMQTIVSALDLSDGLLHTQFISDRTDFWIIECMRRCPGDLYGHHFKFALGYDYEAQYVRGFLGKAPEPPSSETLLARIERQVISLDHSRAFFGVAMGPAAAELLYIPLKNSGDVLEAAPFDKAGIAFLSTRVGAAEVRERQQRIQASTYDSIMKPVAHHDS